MADFDATVALQAKGYDPQDAVAPLQAYMMAAQGRNLDAEAAGRDVSNQLAGLSLASKQKFANVLATPGADQVAGLNASGLGAYDPDAASKSFGNIQSTNTLAALKSYSANPGNPNSLALAGPGAVGEASTAQQTQVATSGVNQDVEKKKADLRGQIALGYMTAVQKAQTQQERDTAWHQATMQAHASSVISPLTAQHGIDNITDDGQRMTIARQWAAAGAGSVVNSGDSAGNNARETNLNTFQKTSPGETVSAPPPLLAAMNGGPPPAGFANPALTSGGTPPAQGYGRSAAVDGQAPATPAQGNGGRAPAPTNSQPPLMTQAESQYGLPTNYLGRTAQIESGGRANASNPSGAAGLFQFVPATWAKYGAPGTSPLNPQAATIAAARLAADNSASLTKALGRAPTGAELYLAHQQGAAGAAGLLSNPSAPAASIVGARAVVSNGGTPNMSAGAFAAMWERKFNGAGNSGNFSLSGPSQMGQGVSMPPAEPTSTLPGTGGTGLRAAADATPSPTQPDLAPPVAGPIPLPSSTQPMPTAPQGADQGRSASETPAIPPTRPLAQGLTPVVSGLTPFQYAKQGLDAARAVDEEKSARDGFVAANTAQSGLMQL